MFNNRDFVIVGIQPWDIGIGSNCKNIALELSKHNRVLYVNQPLDRITQIRQRKSPEVMKRASIIRGEVTGLEQLDKNLWTLYPSFVAESINKLPRGLIYNFFNKRNNQLFAKEIKRTIEEIGFKDIVLFNDSLMFLGFYLKELLSPAVSIYYIRDNLISQRYFKKHGAYMEPQLASKYDVVVSNSDYLAKYLAPFNKHAYMTGQGCDFTLFDSSDKDLSTPDDLKSIRKPIIGYVGFLTSMRLDIKLLEYLATNKPEYSFVLVGPEDDDFKSSQLHYCKNVYFLGAKPERELLNYLRHFDVCINPQLVNEMTIGNYPRKIDEYLALGKPTVATYTETMDFFKDHVYLSNDFKNFEHNIDQALLEDSDHKRSARISFARKHTWENSVNEISNAVNKFSLE